ncbi:hypothetical protein [Lacticaseibacillus songhuajiangensis]|uniref:hypothetical protein n=1 Tax=Lacticaseibacillus songhuajiangensis TaxID=1296539 RepID=UPI000F775844|nr:hypothetical protein [Lacticaseibacillus songhuajiangensis]
MTKQTTTKGIDSQTAISFWHQNEYRARLTALGIAALIAALALPIYLSDHGNDDLGAGLYLLGTAIGVMLIIAPRLGHSGHKHRRVLIAKATRQLAQQELHAYQHARTIGMVFGIGMCIASIAPAMMFNDDIGAACFMLFLAIGVFFLVYVNLVNGAYRRLTKERARLK